MVPMPVIQTPFLQIAMDIVGPLHRTKRGHWFILTIVDYATRYPEAIALSSTEAPNIARELVQLFSRAGIPEEILMDQGTSFMSALLQEVYRLLHVNRIRTTPYHPQTDGLVERFNGTVKGIPTEVRELQPKGLSICLTYCSHIKTCLMSPQGFPPSSCSMDARCGDHWMC